MTTYQPQQTASVLRAATLQALVLAAVLLGIPASADDFDRLLATATNVTPTSSLVVPTSTKSQRSPPSDPAHQS